MRAGVVRVPHFNKYVLPAVSGVSSIHTRSHSNFCATSVSVDPPKHETTSPRLQSTSSSNVITTLCGARASERSPPSSVERAMRRTRVSRPEGMIRTRSPAFTVPEAIVPANPRKSSDGRITYCTGMRNGATGEACSTRTFSSNSKIGAPLYQAAFAPRVTTFSPVSALTGTAIGPAIPTLTQ